MLSGIVFRLSCPWCADRFGSGHSGYAGRMRAHPSRWKQTRSAHPDVPTGTFGTCKHVLPMFGGRVSEVRGVARRRPRGPGLNLKMLKSNNRKTQIHFYTKFHIVMLNIVTVSFYYCPTPETLIQNLPYFTYLCLHIYIGYLCNNWLNDHSYFWCEYDLVISNPWATKHILKIVDEIGQHQARH